jgi:hypothetical protein
VKHHGRDCLTDACDYCMELAEDKAYDIGDRDDWQLAQTQYERHLDRMGEPS